MNYTLETLRTFVEVADLLSFSGAARKMGKSQSTVSTTIANFEADLNMFLFERNGREITLTVEGRKILSLVQEILSVSHRLEVLSVENSDDVESAITIAFSDIYHMPNYSKIFHDLAQKFPHIEFEFITGEDDTVIELLRQNKAHLGMHQVVEYYPADIASHRLPFKSKVNIYVHKNHPLASQKKASKLDLIRNRQLCLSDQSHLQFDSEKVWRAPSYILLLEMAELGLGWSILPDWFVTQFGHGHLVKLSVEVFPQYIEMDLIWLKCYIPKKAGKWLMGQLLQKDVFKLDSAS